MTTALAWAKEFKRAYFGNATAVRDYRVQLRGNRPMIVWSIYLLLLIVVGYSSYQAIAGSDTLSIAEAQMRLYEFYQTVIAMLATAVVLVAPVLGASSIVLERQRQSLDLVFSAPVTPRYYLVGKLIACYRYIWMLLVLALPITATCVVLGGATWSDVIQTYILLSLHGLVYTALALLISAYSTKPAVAVVQSYILTSAILLITSMIGVASTFSSLRGGGHAAPVSVTFSIYSSGVAAPTTTELWGHAIPNWILFAIIAVLLVRILLLGAASALTTVGSSETKSLRFHTIVYLGVLMLVLGNTVFATTISSYGLSSGTSSQSHTNTMTGMMSLAWILLFFVGISAPFVCCSGIDSGKKYWPDGFMRWRRLLKGTPSGAWPFLMTLILIGTGGLVLGFYFAGFTPDPILGVYLYWLTGLWTFVWGIGQLSSSWWMGVRSARVLMVTMLVFIFALPSVILAYMTSREFQQEDLAHFWAFSPACGFLPVVFQDLSGKWMGHSVLLGWGTLFWVMGLFLAIRSEKKLRAKFATYGDEYERSLLES